MAKKQDEQAKAATAEANAAPVAAPAAPAPAEANAAPAPVAAPADPAPATDLQNPSGAIMEPEIARSVDLKHESVDADPRAGTTAVQNAIDWNDAKRAKPQDDSFAGQGLDQSVYGKGPKA